ncbi:unnamed protein product [Nezara viridula]|uniref:Nuclear receptor domain-containing protein n=1 Tax=Nezara viridula TaxID=85310 RepID=A0A9P0H386_NEZVI|nr:unnamed protein product [Nezara viridula]
MAHCNVFGSGGVGLITHNPPDHPLCGFKHFCSICGDRCKGKHFGVHCCLACNSFFRRTIGRDLSFTCENKNCMIDLDQRNKCQYCRYQRCLAMGMKREAVKNERQRLKESYQNELQLWQLKEIFQNKLERRQLKERDQNELERRQLKERDQNELERRQMQERYQNELERRQMQERYQNELERRQMQERYQNELERRKMQERYQNELERRQMQERYQNELERRKMQERYQNELERRQMQVRYQNELERQQMQERYQNELERQQMKDRTQNELESISSFHSGMPIEMILEAERRIDIRVERIENYENANTLFEEIQKQLVHLIEWAQQIPHFTSLPIEDQLLLLRKGWNELLLAGFSHRSVRYREEIVLRSGVTINRNTAEHVGFDTIIFDRVVTEVVPKMREIKIDKAALGCLRAIILYNPD